MSSSRTISANGIEIFLLEQGEGPLVVLCHGWPELSYSWRHQIAALAAAGFHVVAPDMRGFNKLRRDRTQNRIPLLLIALQGCLTSAVIGSARETSAKPVLFAQPPTVRTPTSRQRR